MGGAAYRKSGYLSAHFAPDVGFREPRPFILRPSLAPSSALSSYLCYLDRSEPHWKDPTGVCKGCYANLHDPANRGLIDDAAVSTMPLWAASKVMPNGKTRWMQAEIQ